MALSDVTQLSNDICLERCDTAILGNSLLSRSPDRRDTAGTDERQQAEGEGACRNDSAGGVRVGLARGRVGVDDMDLPRKWWLRFGSV